MPGDPAAVPVRDAATVMLVRDGASGVEVFLQERVGQMAFAAGMTVFPGGGVDERDLHAQPGAGADSGRFAAAFRVTPTMGRALVYAAVRETFEECGVLLVADGSGAVVRDARRFHGYRRALEGRLLSFGEFLARENLRVRADLLTPWAHWITPVGEPRRYDTRFFLAAVPDGQDPDGDTSEAAHAGWETPTRALEDWRIGARLLMPPTWAQLRRLAAAGSVAELRAVPPEVVTVEPGLDVVGATLRVRAPDMDEYYDELASQRRLGEAQPPAAGGVGETAG